MLIGDEAVTSSGFLETISGRRKQSRWTCQSRKHAENLEFFKMLIGDEVPVFWKPFD